MSIDGLCRLGRALVVVLLLISAGTASAARPSPMPTMAGTTTISTTGNRVVELRLPVGARLDKAGVRLRTRGASYVFATAMPRKPVLGCPDFNGRYCTAWGFSWIRGIDDDPAATGGRPVEESLTVGTTLPPLWEEPTFRLFILTDGAADLTLRWPQLRGNTRVTATGRFLGGVSRLRTGCLPEPCSSGRPLLSYGGKTIQIPPGAKAWTEIFAVSADGNGRPTTGAVRQPSICFYPHGADTTASPDAATHPLGCDDRTPRSDGVGRTAAVVVFGVGLGYTSYSGASSYWSEARGKQYLGFTTGTVAPPQTTVDSNAFGVWFVH